MDCEATALAMAMAMDATIADGVGIGHDDCYGYDPIGVPPDTAATLTLIHRSATTQIYRHGKDGGIKVAVGSRDYGTEPSPFSRLENERRISNHLSLLAADDDDPSGRRRRPCRTIAEVGSFCGAPALRFAWVPGVTLRRWSLALEEDNMDDVDAPPWRTTGRRSGRLLGQRLRAAIAVARALRDHHALDGVAHLKLSAENVLLDVEEGTGRVAGATLIDWSRGTILSDRVDGDGSGGKEEKLKDLEDLGRLLSELFRERRAEPDGDWRGCGDDCGELVEEDNSSRARRTKREKRGDAAIDGLPAYFSSLVSALARARDAECEAPGERYVNAADVVADLEAGARKEGTYFASQRHDHPSNFHSKDIPATFHGRETELDVLVHSLESVVDLGRPAMAVVSGHGGMGKTTLVNQIKKPLKERHNGYWISGKFDLNSQRPDLVIFSAINSFFSRLMEEDEPEGERDRLRKRITGVMGGMGIGVLTKSIPNLGKFIHNYEHQERTWDNNPNHYAIPRDATNLPLGGDDHVSQQVFLCKLIGAIAHRTNPIVMVIDDLQWADETSLLILKMIATDPDTKYCLYVGCYRNDDELLTQRVKDMLDGIERLEICVNAINLAPLAKESVNTMISEAFCLPPSLSQQLSSVVYYKTAGAPIYVMNFLSSLCNEGLIGFNLTTCRWEYQINKIRDKELPTGVVQYMTSQMEILPQSNCLVLKVAACLGHQFDYHTFKKAKVKKDLNLEEILPTVVSSFGFIQEREPNCFAWAHDQVQQAAYGLIPLDRREAFHLLIGTQLLMNTPISEMEKSIFDIVGQINIGRRLLLSDAQIYEVGELNFLAGQQALKTSSFHSAALYFKSGIEILKDDHWESQYSLAMKLHDSALEALFATGDFTTLSMLASNVLTHARSFDDKLNCYQNLVRCLASSRQAEQGIATCISVLEHLGETAGISMGLGITMRLDLVNFLSATLPSQISDVAVYADYRSLKSVLDRYSEEDILNLPQMVHERKLVAMDFMNHMISTSNNTRPHLCVIVMFRMVKITLEYGLCNVSAIAFSGYGNIVALDQDFETAHRFGRIALKVMDRLGKDNRFQARVYTNVYGFINVWKEPFQASLPKLLEGYDVGCLHGDMEYCYWQLQMHCMLSLNSGVDLAKLKRNATIYAKRAIQYNQLSGANGIVTVLSAALELAGDAKSRDDAYETFFNCTEDVFYEQLISGKETRTCMLVCNKGKLVSLFKGDIEAAVQYYDMALQNHPRTTAINLIMGTFADGLIAFICAQKHGQDQKKWTNIGLGVIKKMKKWMLSSPFNFENKVYLLEAENHVLKGNYELAIEKFEDSILAARRHRFIHEEGLAFERAGSFYLDIGSKGDAVIKFIQAKRCYELWGAHALVSRIAQKFTPDRPDSCKAPIGQISRMVASQIDGPAKRDKKRREKRERRMS